MHWVGSSKRDLLNFPAEVVDEFGYELAWCRWAAVAANSEALEGVKGPAFSSWWRNFRGDTFRVAYHVRFAKAVYVLHCFQKKSPSGIYTAKSDIDLIHERLKTARNDYEVRYGKED